MSRTAALLIAGAVLAGCGASNNHPAAPPKLPASVATELAARSDQVAAALDQGNSCQALDSANALQQDTIRLINEGRVPGPFQEELSASLESSSGDWTASWVRPVIATTWTGCWRMPATRPTPWR